MSDLWRRSVALYEKQERRADSANTQPVKYRPRHRPGVFTWFSIYIKFLIKRYLYVYTAQKNNFLNNCLIN